MMETEQNSNPQLTNHNLSPLTGRAESLVGRGQMIEKELQLKQLQIENQELKEIIE
jgi:hypothetical protein